MKWIVIAACVALSAVWARISTSTDGTYRIDTTSVVVTANNLALASDTITVGKTTPLNLLQEIANLKTQLAQLRTDMLNNISSVRTDFANNDTAKYNQVTSEWKAADSVINATVTDKDTRLLSIERYFKCSDLIKKSTTKLNATSLNTAMDAANDVPTICGTGFHVCNYQEISRLSMIGCTQGFGENVWMIGGFPNTEGHRRSIWNSQDSVQCLQYNFPAYWPVWNSYVGRVHCEANSTVYGVACCRSLTATYLINNA